MRLLLLLAMVLSLSSCAKEDDGNMGKFSKPDTLPQRFSYVYGFLLAEAAADYRDMDYSQVIHGISDYSYSSPEFSAPEMNDILTRYQQLLLADMESRRAALAESNRASAAEFLRINGQRTGVSTMESGLQYEVLGKGSGESAEGASGVVVDYTLTLPDGTVADSQQDASMDLGRVVSGFREAVHLMHIGDRMRFWLPPELGYGDEGNSIVEPGSLLIFEIELLDIIE